MIWPSPPWVEAPQLRQLCRRVRAGCAGKEPPGCSLPARVCFDHLSCFPLPKELRYGLILLKVLAQRGPIRTRLCHYQSQLPENSINSSLADSVFAHPDSLPNSRTTEQDAIPAVPEQADARSSNRRIVRLTLPYLQACETRP